MEQVSNKKISDFIHQEKQDVVVKGCIQIPKEISHALYDSTRVECWGPVWKNIEFTTNRIDIQRGDRLTVSRTKIDNKPGEYDYCICENHSVNKIIQDVGINEILKDFDKTERETLLYVAARNR